MPEGLVPYSYVSVASLRVQSLTACVVLPELETVSRQTVLIYGLDSFRRIADRNLNLSTASARRALTRRARRLDCQCSTRRARRALSTCSTARRRVALDGSTRRARRLDVEWLDSTLSTARLDALSTCSTGAAETHKTTGERLTWLATASILTRRENRLDSTAPEHRFRVSENR